jgi:hypothetical protein
MRGGLAACLPVPGLRPSASHSASIQATSQSEPYWGYDYGSLAILASRRFS